MLLVEGEPGIGKSTVLTAIVEQATAMGFTSAVSKADHIARISAAAPLLLALRSGRRPLVSADEVAVLTGRTAEPVLLLDDVTRLLEGRAAETPLLIGVDDVQWADPVSRFVLRSLPARLSESPIVWVFASRHVDDGLLDDLKRTSLADYPVDLVELGPLSRDDIAAMARDRLNRQPSVQLTLLLDRVGGNPFFATQILDGVISSAPSTDIDVPTGFILGVRRGVAELSDTAAELLRVAAVFGQPMSTEDVSALLPGRSGGAVVSALDEVVRERVLECDRDHRLVFRHDLIREVIYADLIADTRRRLHQGCALYLRDVSGDPLTIATHARAAITTGDAANAALLLDVANKVATSMPEAAADLALAAFHAVRPEQNEWLEFGRRCVELLSLVQRCSEAITVADILLAHVDDDEAAAHIEIAVARALWLAGTWQESVRRSAKALARPEISAPLRARLAALHALALSRVERAADAGPVAEQALAEADRLDDQTARMLAQHALAEIARNRADHEASLRHFRALRAASGPTYIAQEIQGLQHLDRFHDASVMLARARRDLGVDKGLVFVSLIYSQIWWNYHLGRLDEAEAGASTLLDLALERGSYSCGIEAASLLSLVALQRGEIGLARQRLTSGFGPATGDDERRVPSLLLVRGWVTALEGDTDEAMAMLSPLVFSGRAECDPWPWKPGWLRMLAQLGLTAGANDFTQEVVHLAALGAERNPEVLSLTGTAAQLRGIVGGDIDLVRRGAGDLARSPRPLLRAGGFEDLGFALLDRDERREAGVLLDRSWDVYQRIGATGPMTALQDKMRKAGFRRGQWEPAGARPEYGWEALTPAEVKVARLIASGHSNKTASAELGVSVNTVGTHLRSVFTKLGVRSRVQLSNLVRTDEIR